MQVGDIIGLQRGRYTLVARLGHSSYGSVWSADGPAGPVAVKLINRAQMALAAPALRTRWADCARREIGFLQSLSAWDDRHIVRLLDCGEHDGLPAMALERMDADLSCHAGKATPLQQVLGWMAQANQAIARVHQYGWRYLDLKPSNLLLDARGGVRLADFGTCLPLSAPPHDYVGTANWQAPEQAIPDQDGRYETEARTDYFALGALFYYLVTGGEQLRFCRECGDARRQHGGHAGDALKARYPGGIVTVGEDEARLFLDRVGAQLPRRARAQAERALALLRWLTAVRPAGRPRHALDISRRLDELQAMPASAPWHLNSFAAGWLS